jgi:hypothetical protein
MLNALEACTLLSELNFCLAFAQMRKGNCEELDLSKSELGAAAALYLHKSAMTLRVLDLRLLICVL